MSPPTPTDIHFLPPSSSVLVALSSLTPPSPILSAIGVHCSDDHIPILFDIGSHPALFTLYSASTSPSLCTVGQPGVIYSSSVGTFGPLHRQSQGAAPNSPGDSNPSWPTTEDQTDDTPSHTAFPTSTPISPSSPVTLRPLRCKFKLPIDCDNNWDTTVSTSKSWVQVLDTRQADSSHATLAAPGSGSTDVCPPLLRQPPIHCPSPPQECDVSLQTSFSWLKDTVLELLVDQEGFRAVHPTFRLVGLPKQARGWDSSDGVLAFFRPIKRETFNFHYAPLDGLPILRRITVNGDESRDYISRQATLCLKANGVYTVQGGESYHTSPPFIECGVSKTGTDHTKLKWKFDYLVNDRLEQSGRVFAGEKTITPLSFICSPWLLHPSQARKMKFMHIVKKSVTTKLVAEKLEPPTLPSEIPKTAVNHRLWSLHRRVHSSQADEHKPKRKTGSFRRAGQNSEYKARRDENQNPEQSFVSRRRRASSAGEERRPTRGESYLTTAIPFSKHIVPRAQLAELLKEGTKVSTHVQEASSQFRGLSPAPRHGLV